MESFLQKKRREDPFLSLPFLEELALASCSKKKRAPSSEVKELFPFLSTLPLLTFSKNSKKKEETKKNPLRVGVVFSGGPAPGGHNVLYGMIQALKKIDTRSVLYGFLEGPSGIIEGRYRKLSFSLLQRYVNQGGFDVIGSGRTKIEELKQFKKVAKQMKKLSLQGLVIIGGDDSNTNAALLAEYFFHHKIPTQVIGVPKTIDGDLQNKEVQISFGFHSACKTYSEIIGNIAREALSSKKYYHFIRVMGRAASHVTLECALQTNPNYLFLREEIEERNLSLKEVTDILEKLIRERAKKGKNYGVILFPEGMVEAISELKVLLKELSQVSPEKLSSPSQKVFSELPFSLQKQLVLEKDPHGNIPVSKIETEKLFFEILKKRLQEKKIPFEGVCHFLGYEGRCCFPSFFDSTYCYYLGKVAIELLRRGATGYMAAVTSLKKSFSEWKAAGVPLTSLMTIEERKGKKKPVIKKSLVNINSKKIKKILNKRDRNQEKDNYLFPGPMQFSKDPFLLGERPSILYFR